jgi:hypothetical protein
MRIKTTELLCLIQEGVMTAFKENKMGKTTTITVELKGFEAGPILVRGNYYPGRRGSMETPPEYPEFELRSIFLKGKEMSPEEFLKIENKARVAVGEDPLDEEEFHLKVAEEVLESELDYGY